MSDETLSDEVASLREQVALLRQVLDEVLVELAWAMTTPEIYPLAREPFLQFVASRACR
jgi:hypothetical protein